MIRSLISGFWRSRPEDKRRRVDFESPQTFPKELNENIHELYKPAGQPAVEILFFHGLQFGDTAGAYLSTWRTRDDSQIWPATWLAEEFPDAHILSVSYDASMRTTPEQGRLDLFSVAENLMHALCLANIGQGFCRPVILVGHSFGGLVIKQLCVEAHRIQSLLDPDSERNQKVGKFLHNVGGLFFYGTPHRGIPIPQIATPFLNSRLLVYVKVLGAEGARLETEFDAVCKKHKIWHIASVGESMETSCGPLRVLVVPEASARYGADFCTVAADHIALCKPPKKTSMSFQRLIDFIPKVHIEARFENIQRLPKAAVGLDREVGVVREKLHGSRGVGIHGMGGVGKTTLAKAVFNKLGPTFEYSCFCPDVKLIEGAVRNVQQEIWERMHCEGNADKGDGWSIAKLRGKRVLLILDDVARDRDVEVLLHIEGVVAVESRFIMTSRDKEILNLNLDNVNVELYELPFLSEKDAKPLFLSHAFPYQAGPSLALESHVDAIVTRCGGLPLTLEVIGRYLQGKENGKIWEQTLDALINADFISKHTDESLWEKLRPSYSGLREDEQQMFLDATTFFSDMRWSLYDAKAAWSVSYGNELLRWQSLVDASLVYDVKDDEPIKVHEQLQSLGRKIASEDKTRRRVWKMDEGWMTLQSIDESDDQEIHSLQLCDEWEEMHSSSCVPVEDVIIPRSSVLRLEKLQYLDSDHVAFGRVFIDGAQENETLQTDLVLLRCRGLQFGQVLFNPAHLPRLAILHLAAYDQHSLPNSFGQLSNLKILKVRDPLSLHALPESFGGLAALNHLEFWNCTNLHTLPESFGALAALNHLEFSGCTNLHTLPESFGALSALNHLKFTDCENLHTLQESFGALSALNHLEFIDCKILHTLPESFGALTALNHLLFDTTNLHNLPESFGGLSALDHLEFIYCENLHTLPESFGGLSALNHLLFQSTNLHTLPASFGDLSALNHLEVKNCYNFHTLPESFGRLFALNHLLFDTTNLHTLPQSFGALSALNHLKLLSCKCLDTLPQSFGQLEDLDYLQLHFCPKLERFPDSFSQLKGLRHLTVKLLALKSIPTCIKNLPSLQILELGSLPELKELPPWLGQILPPTHFVAQRFFRTQNGNFALKEMTKEVELGGDGLTVFNWLVQSARDKMRAFDYIGALEGLGAVDLEFVPSSYYRYIILKERGILKRLTGNLGEALEDLTAALEIHEGKDDYEIQKHVCELLAQ